MLKKYIPYFILLAAGFAYWYIKQNQNVGSLNRSPARIEYTQHARCRMACRHIDESEVQEILEKGVINVNKIEKDAKGKKFPLEGITHDNQNVRIVFAPEGNRMVVITVIDLGKDWDCDCR
jgi:hypothetical protein